jgi:hypothetical protein
MTATFKMFWFDNQINPTMQLVTLVFVFYYFDAYTLQVSGLSE